MDMKTFKIHFDGVDRDFIVEDVFDAYAVDKALLMLSEEEKRIIYSRILIMPDIEEINPDQLN